MKYHVHVVLIQDIKELIEQSNITIYHTLREGNQCAYFMAKFGTIECWSPQPFFSSKYIMSLLKIDAAATFFL